MDFSPQFSNLRDRFNSITNRFVKFSRVSHRYEALASADYIAFLFCFFIVRVMFKKLVKTILNYLSKLTVEQEDVVGIDITPGCIRVAQLESSKKKWTLTKLGYKYIEVQGGYNAAKDLIDSNPQQYVNKLLQVLNSNKIKTKSAAS